MARSLGIPPGELMDRTTGNDITLWRAYERLEPPDVTLLHAILAAQVTLCNLQIAKGKKLTVEDFLPRASTAKPRRKQTFREKAARIALAFGGRMNVIDHTRRNGPGQHQG